MPHRSFMRELRRRHVFRVAAAYAVVGWVVIEVATQVFPVFHMPDWAAQLVVLLILIGFPIALVLAWAFEMTPEGVRRTEPADSPAARPAEHGHRVGRLLNSIIIAVLALAVAVLAWKLMHANSSSRQGETASVAQPQESAGTSSAPPSASASIPAKSIAVLPFENLSGDKDNEYFVAGMQDLILTKLADIGDLTVISRTSTMQYGSHPQNLKTIAQQLGVANVLEGSVQKAGKQVLINVQLIDADKDHHIWAEAYTRTLENIFGVEGEVAEKIAQSLQAKLSPVETQRLAAVPTENQAAYDLFLRAEFQLHRGDINYATDSWKAAIQLYRQAIDKDPKFALALARLSYTESQLAWFGGGGESVKELNAQALADAQRASALAPELPASQLALGYSEYWGRGDYASALNAFAAALKLRPNDADTLAARSYVERRQGRFDAAIASLQQALALDPRNSSFAFELGTTYAMANRYADADTWYQRALALDPDNRNAKSNYALNIVLQSGDVARALAAAQGDAPVLQIQRVSLLILQRKYKEALTLLAGVHDTPDNFSALGGSKALQTANLYRLAGDASHAQPLFAQAKADARTELAQQQGINLAFVWDNLASAELGLGHTADGLEAVAKSQAIVAGIQDRTYGARITELGAAMYAQAQRPELAVPLLTKALASPGLGTFYSPTMLWLDPAWDPIRKDPGFQALLAQYADRKPAANSAESGGG